MKCIFICVFNNVNYVDMCYLLLDSIFLYGNLRNDTDILIYTSTEFMNMIKQSRFYNDKIKFEINDTYNSIEAACKARLDIFNLPTISNYEKVLYLDTDIVIKDSIDKVFGLIRNDILYVLEEGDIDENQHGKKLFGNEINNYNDKSAFTSGILLFNNCEATKDLFEK
jgi:lipopolysaccharide biosynthesis glycosyltransferase